MFTGSFALSASPSGSILLSESHSIQPLFPVQLRCSTQSSLLGLVSLLVCRARNRSTYCQQTAPGSAVGGVPNYKGNLFLCKQNYAWVRGHIVIWNCSAHTHAPDPVSLFMSPLSAVISWNCALTSPHQMNIRREHGSGWFLLKYSCFPPVRFLRL